MTIMPAPPAPRGFALPVISHADGRFTRLAQLAKYQGRIDMRAISLAFALALLTTCGAPALASTIDFGDLVAGSSFTTYANSGFTVSPTSGSWMVNDYGAPSLSIVFSRAAVQPTTTGQIQITAGGSPFTFSSVDLYSSITPIPYEFTGLLGAASCSPRPVRCRTRLGPS
jgi:hypothetical protein